MDPIAWFLDDLRTPPHDGRVWTVLRSSQEALDQMNQGVVPLFVSFDHDLGGDDIAMRVVHALIERDLDAHGRWLPMNFAYTIHSANPVGAANLDGLLGGYLRWRWSNEHTRSGK